MKTANNSRPLPHSTEVTEDRFIAAVIKDSDGDRWRECRKLPPEAFTDYNRRNVWQTIVAANTYEDAALARNVSPYFANETTGVDYEDDRDEMFFGWLRSEGLSFAPTWLAALPGTTTNANLLTRLYAGRFNHAVVPAEPTPRFLINGHAVCTPGNLTNIIAHAKSGKTAVIGAFIAAAICAEYGESDRDTLGITATAPGSKRLIHFDTEQSPFDHDQLIRRAMRRAGADTPPAWLDSYGCAGFSAVELRQSLARTMKDAQANGGVFAVILDGTADLVVEVNDPAECNPFVAELHALAIAHDCPILNVVHENPGQDAGKMRGHLGSQLERKAESNLRLRKAEEVTTIFSEKMRKAPILEKDGPRFRWSDDAGMHVSAPSSGTLREADSLADLRDLAAEVFSSGTLRYADACEKIEKARRVGEKAGEKWFTRMKKSNVIRNVGMGIWEVTTA